jgi:ABC-type Mn2+/Zn2+ transport system ATPase subunit
MTLAARTHESFEGHPEQLAGIGHRPSADALISIENMSFRYPDGVLALEDIDLSVSRGSMLAIIGPNGGGKTTLLKIMLGLLHGYSGSVRIAGMPPAVARRQGGVMSWVPQRSRLNWMFPVTLRETVAMGLMGRTGLLRRPSRSDREYVRRILHLLEIESIANRPIGSLSGGQQQRALVARALAPRPMILMLDEPGVGIDAVGTRRLRETLAQIHTEFGIALVTVSHDLRLALSDAQRVACLNCRLHFHDAPGNLSKAMLDQFLACGLDGILPPACPHDHDGPQDAGGRP